jgi:hypothetical protein
MGECVELLSGMLSRLVAAMQTHMPGSSSSSSSSRGVPGLEKAPLGIASLAQLTSVLLGAASAWLPCSSSSSGSGGRESVPASNSADDAGKVMAADLTAGRELWAPHAVQLTAALEAITRAAVAANTVATLWRPFKDAAGVQRAQAQYREAVFSSVCGLCVSADLRTPGVLLEVGAAAGP